MQCMCIDGHTYLAMSMTVGKSKPRLVQASFKRAPREAFFFGAVGEVAGSSESLQSEALD